MKTIRFKDGFSFQAAENILSNNLTRPFSFNGMDIKLEDSEFDFIKNSKFISEINYEIIEEEK